MTHLNRLLKMGRRLNDHARRLNIDSRCPLILLEHELAQDRLEDDGKTYHYPEVIHFNIENWNTFKGCFRMRDGRVIREGTDLDGDGMSLAKLYRRMLVELKAFAAHCALHAQARKQNAIVYSGKLVPVEGFEARQWFGRETIFVIHTDKGIESKWYGRNAENALENSHGFLPGNPLKITLAKA